MARECEDTVIWVVKARDEWVEKARETWARYGRENMMTTTFCETITVTMMMTMTMLDVALFPTVAPL